MPQLAVRGRSTYTQRAYALGLAALVTWLVGEGLRLADVYGVVERYIAAFRSAPKADAVRVDVGRAGEVNPRTHYARGARPRSDRYRAKGYFLGDYLLGSTAAGVARHAHCPVVVVR